jgi:hypothetical protein
MQPIDGISRSLRALALAGLCFSASALAGPPYVTDDPEPVDYRHWELYLASFVEHNRDGWDGTSPHLEANYGAAPDLQLHVITPLAFNVPDGQGARLGLGDIELGVKWRFVHETKVLPQIGTFPFLELPTGMASRDLGNGALQLFLPIWLQKSIGPITSYGGGGAWFNAASGKQTWWYFGWQAQWQVVEPIAIGAEVFYETPKVPGGEAEARFNVGVVLDVSEHQHILLSAGRGFVGPNSLQGYVAWLLTLGPEDRESGHQSMR